MSRNLGNRTIPRQSGCVLLRLASKIIQQPWGMHRPREIRRNPICSRSRIKPKRCALNQRVRHAFMDKTRDRNPHPKKLQSGQTKRFVRGKETTEIAFLEEGDESFKILGLVDKTEGPKPGMLRTTGWIEADRPHFCRHAKTPQLIGNLDQQRQPFSLPIFADESKYQRPVHTRTHR
jgi:hypothetical protein